VNELGQVVQPLLPGGTNPPQVTTPEDPTLLTGDRSFGRGSALEVGLANPVPNDKSDIVPNPRTQASSPPDHVPTTPHSAVPPDVCKPDDPLCKQLIPVPAGPLAFAQVLQNEAASRWQPPLHPPNADPTLADGPGNNCIVGAPYGEG